MISLEGPIPAITFSKRVQQELANSIKLTVVVRFLNGDPRYNGLNAGIIVMWKPNGNYFKIVNLENSYYLVMFEKESDYPHVLLNGLWLMRITYLMVQPWSPSLSTSNVIFTSFVVWFGSQVFLSTITKKVSLELLEVCQKEC